MLGAPSSASSIATLSWDGPLPGDGPVRRAASSGKGSGSTGSSAGVLPSTPAIAQWRYTSSELIATIRCTAARRASFPSSSALAGVAPPANVSLIAERRDARRGPPPAPEPPAPEPPQARLTRDEDPQLRHH